MDEISKTYNEWETLLSKVREAMGDAFATELDTAQDNYRQAYAREKVFYAEHPDYDY